MTIEATLESIDTSLKALLAAVQSGNTFAAGVAIEGTVETTDAGTQGKKRGRPAKADPATAEPTATSAYWVSDSLKQAYEQLPGNAAPVDKSFVQVTAEQFAAKKAEYAAPTAADNQPTWDAAVTALKTLAQHPDHGSNAVMFVIKALDPQAQNVPHLKDRGLEAAIIAKVNELLHPPVAAADPLFG